MVRSNKEILKAVHFQINFNLETIKPSAKNLDML